MIEDILKNPDERVIRKLSDLEGCFSDKRAFRKLLKRNPVIYRVWVKKFGELSFGITKINPGRVGKEFWMTKGHYHLKPSPEIYLLLSGRAVLLMQKGGKSRKVELEPGRPVLVPPGWAHRVVNPGLEPCLFLAIYPSDAGHDYERIMKEGGFRERIFSKPILGLDLGGSYLKAVRMDFGTVERKLKLKTPRGRGAILEKLDAVIRRLGEAGAIGIAVPGLVKEGRLLKIPNLPELNGFQLRDWLEEKFGLPTKVENDTNCMTLAEKLWGHGKNAENFIYLSLGTGIGGGLVIQGSLYRGRGFAGEFGHLNLEPSGLPCSCGSKGCIEEYASARGIKRLAEELGLGKLEPEEIARMKNQKAKEVFRRVSSMLAVIISDLIKALDPDLVILGGGISKAGQLILKPLRQEVRKRTFFSPPQIKLAKLDEWAGAIGAAGLFL